MNSNPLNNDSSGFSINNPLVFPSVFVLVLVLRDLRNLRVLRNGYALVRFDNPSNTKRGGFCLYYKNNLPLRVINSGYLNECLTLDLRLVKKNLLPRSLL